MNIEIRRYQDDDYGKVFNILKENFQVEKDEFCKDERVLEFVAVVEDKVVGYFIVRELLDIIKNVKYFYLEYICVDKNFQNRGVGKRIMKFILELAKNKKVKYIELTSGYQRIVAHHLYEKYGFEKRESNIFRRIL